MNSHPQQILSIMADNTSSNNTMITKLTDMVGHFGGKTVWTFCFLHIVNLVVETCTYTGTSLQYLPFPYHIPVLVNRTSLAHSCTITFQQVSCAL
ncbi:hypothetical protein BDR05DRAFT_893717 [Suillus weaverae]|nr:hypothetical protein BDR05DRAFT_893717 [Suillus weaverae]